MCLSGEGVVAIYLAVSLFRDVEVLYDICKVLVLVVSADSSGYAA